MTGSATINLTVGGTYTEQGATATDVEDGDLSGSIVIGGDTVNPNTIGVYTVTYNVQDSDNNNATQVTRTVNVVSSVVNVTDVDVSPKTASVTVGLATSITVTVTPNNATNQNGVWSSSNNSVATIDQSGRVTGLSEGNTTIAFTSSDGDFTDTSVITVISQSQNTGGISKKQKIKLINN